MKEITCLRCNTKMHFANRENIQLGQTGWILGDLPNLIAGSLSVDIFICPNCNKIEFFAAEHPQEEDSLPKRTCPSCGAVHDFDFPKCPKCKFDYFGK